jgi:spore coat protein U-like protein
MSRRTLRIAGLLAAGLLSWAAPAAALTTQTATFNVTATVLDNCAVSAGPLAFGNYSASSGAPAVASSSISVTCTSGLHYTVALDGGTTTQLPGARAMTDGTHNLGYGLYTSSGYSSIWGDATAGTVTQTGIGNGAAQPLTVFGRIPASQFVASGSYTDTVTVSVSY